MAKLLPVLVLIVVVVVFASLFISQAFKVKTLEVQSENDCLNKEKVEKEYGVINQNIFLVNTKDLTSKLKAKYACIGTLNVSKAYPSKLIIEVKTKGPVAKIADSPLLLTEDGLIVEGQSPPLTLFLPSGQNLTLGQKLDKKEILFALKLAANITKSDFIANNIRILDATTVAAYNQEGAVVLFSVENDALFQVDSLQLILAKAKIDATKITKLDLRFDKPIIVYKDNGQR